MAKPTTNKKTVIGPAKKPTTTTTTVTSKAKQSTTLRKKQEEEQNLSDEEEQIITSTSKNQIFENNESDNDSSDDDDDEEMNQDDEDALMQQIFTKLSNNSNNSDDEDDEEITSDEEEDESSTLLNHEEEDDEKMSASDDEDDDEDDNGMIELSDLIESIEPGKNQVDGNKVSKKDTEVSGKRLASLTQNLSQLQKIAREKKKGDIYYSVDQVDLELEERRSAYDILDEKMVKWTNVVEHVQNSRIVPLQYKEGRLERRKGIVTSKPESSSNDDFSANMEKVLNHKKPSNNSEENKEIPLYDLDENATPGFKTLAQQYEKLDKAELVKKHQEIAQKRKLMSIQKAKDARLKKIKSKTFRKIANREKRKNEAPEQELTEEELMKLDPEEARARILEKEKKYIQERLTLRHKNSSKWVKRAMKNSQHNQSLRDAVNDQLRKGTELLKKQTTVDYNSDDEDVLVEQMLSEDGSSGALRQLRDEVTNAPEMEKGLFAMKFMKRAREKRQQEHLQLINEIERDVHRAKQFMGVKVDDDSEMNDEDENMALLNDSREPEGRRKFTGQPKNSHVEEEETEPKEQIQFSSALQVQKSHKVISSEPQVLKDNSAPASLKVESSSKSESAVSVNSTPIPKDAQFASSSSNTETKKRTVVVTSVSQKKRRRAPVAVDNAANPWLNVEKEKESRQTKKQKTDREAKESKVKIKTDEKSLGLGTKDKKSKKEKSKSAEEVNFEKSVKLQAFAGDDLRLEFDEEKQKTLQDEINMPNLAGTILPGWDSWVGGDIDWQDQVAENQRRADEAKKKIMDLKQKERADNKLGHVIIRASAKVPDKYINKSLPPSEIPAKIHDNLRAHPLGSEWNSLTSFVDSVKPRVPLRRGTIIAPLDYNTAKASMKWRQVQEDQKLNGGRTADLAAKVDDKLENGDNIQKSSFAQRKEERIAFREKVDQEKQKDIKHSFERKMKYEEM